MKETVSKISQRIRKTLNFVYGFLFSKGKVSAQKNVSLDPSLDAQSLPSTRSRDDERVARNGEETVRRTRFTDSIVPVARKPHEIRVQVFHDPKFIRVLKYGSIGATVCVAIASFVIFAMPFFTPRATLSASNPNSQFKGVESPSFTLDTAGFIKIQKDTRGTGEVRSGDESITASVTRDGKEVEGVEPIISSDSSGTDKFKVELANTSVLKPGKYNLAVKVQKKTLFTGKTVEQDFSQDFSWGVLALNPDKATYSVGETSLLAMAVLTDTGGIDCSASLTLQITDPTGATSSLSTEDGGIVIADTCSDHRLGLAPDYSANYKVAYPGTYKLSLHAETFNGTRDITDGFIADNAVDFQITRDAPTRIYPPLYYPTKITVTASKSFTGTIEETVPASFDIKPGNFNVAQYGQSKMLTWNVSLATGETTVLKYEWKAPDISPEFYVVGPLKFIESSGSNFTLDSGDVVFVEARQWQIASDAAYTCTTTATSGNWSTISWSGCNSSYPGASTANTYSAAINSTATTTIYLNLTPAMSLTTLTIIGNGYAHTLNLFTSAGVGNSLTTTSTVTISAPTSSLTNTIAVGNGSLTTGGNVAITAGTSSGRNSTLSVGNATYGAGSLNVTGNITLSGTGTATLSTLVSGSTVTMNNGTISGAKTVSFVAGSTFTTSGTSTIGGAYTFGGNFAVSDGTTTIGAYLMTVTGTSSITGDLTASSNTGVKTFTGKVTINDGGGVDFSARTFNMTITGGIENDSTDYFKTSTGTVTFSASQEFSGSGPITISGASSISAGFVITNNCTGAVTFTGTVTGGSTSSGITTGLNSDTIILSTAANFLSTGVLTPYNGVNTIEYNYAGAQTIKAETTNDYYNLVLGGSGTKTWVTGVTAIDGDFIMNGTTTATTLNVALTVYGKLDLNQTSTGSLTTAGYALTVNGVTEIAGGTLSLANATGAKTLTGMVTLSGGTLSGSSSNVALGAGITNDGGTVNLTGTVTMSTAGATFSGANNIGITTLTVTSPGTVTNNGTVTLAGNFTGTGSWTQGESSTLNVAGSAANALAVTTFTATATSNLVNYNATGAQTVKAATYYNLTMNATTSRTVSFPNNSTTTVNGTWQANGAASNLITLTRVSSGSWTIAPAAANVSYANVSYSNASTDICAQYSTDGGNNNSSWKFSAGTSCSTLTVGTTGSQTANMSIPSTNNYVGGAFTMSTDTGSATVSSIKISEMGTVAANTNLANAKLYYETAGTCSYDGTESLLGSVQFDSSQQATFTQTFGTNGMVTVTPGETNYNDDLYATAIDSQGNLYAVGDESGDNHNGYDWAIRKYSANGVLDTSFGTSGLVSYDTTAVSGSIDSAYAIAIDTSDNLYVAGAVEPSSGVSVWAIRKYTSSGTLVTGFGSSGMVTYGAYNNNDDTARAIIIDSSNNIYVGGEYYYNWVIRKYTSAGALVTAFGSSGTISSDFGYDDIIHAMTMDSSKSNFYVVGSSSDGISNYWRIAEYTTGGVLVTGFGSSGYVTYDGGGTASDAYAVAIDSSNNLYVAGTQATNGIDWAIRKYTSAGGVVSGFGSSGLVTYNSSGTRQDIAHAITIDSSSNIYVGGSSQNGTNTDWTIRKYTSDGGLATGFGSSGTVTYNSGYQDGIMAIAIDSSSNIYAGGYLSDSNEYYYWAIRKYNSNGVLFDSSGGVTVGTSQVCFYVVLDVGSGASNGQTLEIEITNPSVDISVTGAANTQTSAVAIAGTTNIGAASGISISGTTNLSSGTVAVAIGSTLQSGKTGTIGAGIWVIAGVTTPASGDVITVWVSGSPLSTAATTYDGSGDVDGMALNSHVLSIGNTDNRSLTVSNLGLYDRDNDTNIIHTANSSVLNVDAGNNFSDEQLNILSGNTLTVSGTETVTTHDLSNNGNLTSTGASTYNVSGSWYNNGMTGNFARSTSTVNFTSTTTETVSGFLESSSSFYQVSFNGVGGSWTITDSMTTTATTTTSFVIGNGTVTFGNSNTDALEVDGTMSVAATAGQTGTFQTTPLPAGQVIYVDINNSSQPDCANCKIIVGADSGGSGSPLSPITSTAAGDGMVATDYDTWSAVHGATSGSVAQGSYSYVQPGTWVSGGTYQIARFFAPFANPGGLSGKTITAATITLTQTDTYPSGFGTVNDLFVTADSQASSSGLVVGDYDTLGDTKFSDAINFSAVDTPQTFNLNAAGIAYLNAHKGDASLMLGLRHKADIENVAPSSDGGREIYTANFGTASYRPKLTLTVADPEGQGTFSLQKNTVLRLIPGSSSTSTSIEVKSTGNLNIAGAQETTGTSNGTTNETTLTDTSKNWTTNAYRYATVRMTSGNAKGKTYSITANTATTITRDSNASADVQISSISGSGSTRKICSADTSLSAYNNEYVGSYLNDKTGTTGYLRIVSSTAYDSACSSHNSFTVVAEPSAFSVLATNDYFAISDGVMAGDSFEVVNYAAVTSNDGASCGADTSDELSSYIYAGPGSQLSMNYAYVCNLGDSSNYVRGIDIENINGANANEGASIQNSVIMSNGYVGVYFWNVSNSTISGNEFKNSSDGGIALANSVSNTVTSNRVSGFWTSGISTYPSGSHTYGNMIAFNEIYSSSGSGIYTEEDVIGNTFVSNKVYGNMVGINLLGATQGTKLVSNVIYGNTSDGIVSSFSSASKVTFSSNQIYSNTGAALYLQGDTGTTITAIKDSYGVSGINASGDIVNNYSTTSVLCYDCTMASTTEVSGVAGAYVVSFKHDDVAGSTKIWGDYSIPNSDISETPQTESTNKFNYASNLWEKSITAHSYSGTGTEDTNLDYSLTGATLSGGPYTYQAVAQAGGTANCAVPTVFTIYRNGTATGINATCGTTYTDTLGSVNVSFKIDGGATAYVAGDSYTFTVWDADNSTSVTKSIAMMQDGDILTAPSGSTLELQGDATHITTVSRGGSGGYHFAVAGTINANYYKFSYLGGTGGGLGLDLQSTATVTNLANGTYDNYQNVGSADTYIRVHSNLIGTGSPTKTFANLTFLEASDNVPEYTVTESGGDGARDWVLLAV